MAYDILAEATLADVLRNKAPDGSYMSAIDVLSEKIPLIEEGYWVQGNDDSSHEFMRTTSEPVGSVIALGQGAGWEKSSEVPVKEQIMRLGSNLKLETKTLEKSPAPVRYRRDREKATVRGLTKTFAKVAFTKGGYGDMAADPLQVNGLGARYGKLAAKSVVSMGGSGSNLASIWVLKWGPDGLFFIHPKTAEKTLVEKNMTVGGPQMIADASGNPLWYEITNWEWQFGIGVGDSRNVKRLCNIAPSGNYSFFEDTDKALGEKKLIDLLESFPLGSNEGLVIYTGADMIAQMKKRLNDKSNLYFTTESVWGRPMLNFYGVPIIRMDTLTADESTIS